LVYHFYGKQYVLEKCKNPFKRKKLAQAALAKKCGVSLRTLENWVYRDIIPGLEDALYIVSVHKVGYFADRTLHLHTQMRFIR
jgi:transcriptional regulator with XRE-family HTH domain